MHRSTPSPSTGLASAGQPGAVETIAVLNAGSSSLKFSLFVDVRGELVADLRGQVEGLHTAPRFAASDRSGELHVSGFSAGVRPLGHDGALQRLIPFFQQRLGGRRLSAVGHRVVHGGLDYAGPVRVEPRVLTTREHLARLAPLHQPHNLAPIRLLQERLPDLPQVACFDTAFHRTSPDVAQRFALPAEPHDAGVRRYGFHGLSYEYITSVLPGYDSRASVGRTVVLHLGSGASMCAIAASRAVATTMGFSALDGLPMGTRSGAIDPGVLLHLMDHRGMNVRAVETLLYERSGLLGVSGISSDMRALLASADPRAALAIDLYVYRIGRELGSLAAALGGLDAIVFTAGIGENAPVIRERVCRDAAWLGLELDRAANERGGPCISSSSSRVAAWVIPTNEELMIALHTRRVLQEQSPTRGGGWNLPSQRRG
jgi:acetate kinase